MLDRPRAWFHQRRSIVGPIASAVLLALAFTGLWPLVFVALVPWLLSLQDTTPRQAWNRGYGFGLLFSLTQLWWLGDLAYKWTESVALGVVPWLIASLASAVYYGLLGRLIRSSYRLNALWAIPLVWAGMELFRSYIPVLAFPWALLGEPLVETPFRGLAWYGTIYLVSSAVLSVNVALAHRRWAALSVATIAMAIPVVIWLGLGRTTLAKAGALPRLTIVGAGQPAVDMAFDADANTKIGAAVDALLGQTSNVDILVLPEGIARGGATLPPSVPFHLSGHPAVVFGGQRGTGPVYQSAFAYGPEGWSSADKTRLVIFGEFVPGRDYFPFLQNAFHLPGGDLSAGEKLATVRAGRFTVGPLICFEALFPDLGLRQAYAGADFLAVMSIDDWFAPAARARLANASRWRAIEAGLPTARSGSLGKTMTVTRKGEVESAVRYGERSLATMSLFPRAIDPRGPFALVWLFPLAALGSLLGVPLWARKKATKTGKV